MTAPRFPFAADPWEVVEESYRPDAYGLNEAIFALGNGYMGIRGTPIEGRQGKQTSGTHVPVVHENGTIRYDWCRPGFPTRSQFVPPGPNWLATRITIDGATFDLNEDNVSEYRRTLDLRRGVLKRSLVWHDQRDRRFLIETTRIVCLHRPHLGAVRMTITAMDRSVDAVIDCLLDAEPATHFHVVAETSYGRDGAKLAAETDVTNMILALVTRTAVRGAKSVSNRVVKTRQSVGRRIECSLTRDQAVTIDRIVAVCSSNDHEPGDPLDRATDQLRGGFDAGFDELLAGNMAAWEAFWDDHDVRIDGDPGAQQGIRYCLFNLNWNYTTDDPRVNVGAKGICDCGYGGLYFWDSESYMIPTYTFTDPAKARNLLKYRCHTLPTAREKAAEYGYEGAMFPMVTLDGHECGIPWELAGLEIHVNVTIPYALKLYVESTGDEGFLVEHGAEMLLEVCRFWASRVTDNPRKGYVLNCVTGPDEYMPIVNNNCYTNAMTQAALRYGLDVAGKLEQEHPETWRALAGRISLKPAELDKWRDIVERMYIPFDKKLGIHPQDDAFLDLDPVDVAAIREHPQRLHERWTMERVIRSQALKQPDVLMLMYLQNDRFPEKVIRANYEFYEPITTHESSLSPCIHCILAAELGMEAEAFEYYLMTARLDLDDVNHNASQGIHIANHAGSWMTIANGFAGMRIRDGRLCFHPHLPRKWKRLAFKVRFQGRLIAVEMKGPDMNLRLEEGEPIDVKVGKRIVHLHTVEPTKRSNPWRAS